MKHSEAQVSPLTARSPETGGRHTPHVTRSFGRRSVLAIASSVALILAHHSIYLIAHGPAGYEGGMSADGHDGYWRAWAGGVAVVGGLLAAVAGWQIRRLVHLRHPGSRAFTDSGLRDYIRSMGYWWPRLLVAVTALLVLHENGEYLRLGLDLPALSVLGTGEYGAAMPAIAAVSLLMSAILALIEWCRRSLLARLQGAAGGLRFEQARASTATADRQLISLLLARRGAGRAPPQPA